MCGNKHKINVILPTKTKIILYFLNYYHTPNGRARNFCLGEPICVANLLVYTNFYTHTHTQKISIFHNESLKLNVS